ncbi:MAG: T9SS type A sorting domain-containing protein, partial [Saprospiraceae bacterium]|nr:T9SS type A sorting domain-containing protein [Saprospiraceae bacterium]
TVFNDTVLLYITNYISVTDTLIINLSIPDSSNDPITNRIIAYPNPASSHLHIDFGNHTLMQNYTCQILNALGQPVFFTPVDQKLYYLDLSTWSGKGTYFIKILMTLVKQWRPRRSYCSDKLLLIIIKPQDEKV